MSVLFVTGSSRGIGRELVRAADGFAVTVVHGRDLDRLEPLVAELRGRGRDVLPVAGDLTVADEAAALVDAVHRRTGRIDVLVNNAAATAVENIEAATDITTARWNQVLALNLTAPFLLSRAVHPIMAGHGGGHIVNVGSYAGTAGFHGLAPYSATKAGLVALSQTLSAEWASAGVRVNTVILGPVVPDELAPESAVGAVARGFCWRRDVVRVLAGLAQDLGSTLTGAVLHLDGGAFVADLDTSVRKVKEGLNR